MLIFLYLFLFLVSAMCVVIFKVARVSLPPLTWLVVSHQSQVKTDNIFKHDLGQRLDLGRLRAARESVG